MKGLILLALLAGCTETAVRNTIAAERRIAARCASGIPADKPAMTERRLLFSSRYWTKMTPDQRNRRDIDMEKADDACAE